MINLFNDVFIVIFETALELAIIYDRKDIVDFLSNLE